MRRFLVYIVVLIGFQAYPHGLGDIDVALAGLTERCDSVRSINQRMLHLNEAEVNVLSFMQAVGDLNIIQDVSYSIHGESYVFNANEIENIIQWYAANKRYFTDEMYDAFVNYSIEHPIYERRESGYVEYLTQTFNETRQFINELNDEFLSNKYNIPKAK